MARVLHWLACAVLFRASAILASGASPMPVEGCEAAKAALGSKSALAETAPPLAPRSQARSGPRVFLSAPGCSLGLYTNGACDGDNGPAPALPAARREGGGGEGPPSTPSDWPALRVVVMNDHASALGVWLTALRPDELAAAVVHIDRHSDLASPRHCGPASPHAWRLRWESCVDRAGFQLAAGILGLGLSSWFGPEVDHLWPAMGSHPMAPPHTACRMLYGVPVLIGCSSVGARIQSARPPDRTCPTDDSAWLGLVDRIWWLKPGGGATSDDTWTVAQAPEGWPAVEDVEGRADDEGDEDDEDAPDGQREGVGSAATDAAEPTTAAREAAAEAWAAGATPHRPPAARTKLAVRVGPLSDMGELASWRGPGDAAADPSITPQILDIDLDFWGGEVQTMTSTSLWAHRTSLARSRQCPLPRCRAAMPATAMLCPTVYIPPLVLGAWCWQPRRGVWFSPALPLPLPPPRTPSIMMMMVMMGSTWRPCLPCCLMLSHSIHP